MLLAPLTTGGMGELFLGRLEGSHGFEKLCVIKRILANLASDPEVLGRFLQEAKTVARLSHGAVAQVLDLGIHENAPYLVMEHVDGKDLRRVIARSRERSLPLPLTFVLFVMGRVLDALGYVHRKRGEDERELGLIHRDVSPQNVLVSYEGEVKVIDFGLAKSALNPTLTHPSIILGKFLYMSPEQSTHKPMDRRSDLYSVGVCLYELISGKNPFEDFNSAELIAQVSNPRIPSLQTIDPLYPPDVVALVSKALAPNLADRFQSAEEFASAVRAALNHIDPNVGADSIAKFMRETFAADYASERKLYSSLKDVRAARPELLREEGANGTTRPGASPLRGLKRAPALGADVATALTSPSLVGLETTAVGPAPPPLRRAVSLSSPLEPETQSNIPWIAEPIITPVHEPSVVVGDGSETQPRVVLGTLLDEPTPASSPAPVLSLPAHQRIESRENETTTVAPPVTDQGEAGGPWLARTWKWVLLIMVLGAAVAGAAVMAYRAFVEMEEDASTAKRQPPPILPELLPDDESEPRTAASVAAPAPAAAEEGADELAPLTPGKKAQMKKAPRRKAGRGRHLLIAGEFDRVLASFTALRGGGQSCESLGTLCARMEKLKAEVADTADNVEIQDRVLRNVRGVAAELERISKGQR
ncbi:MAG: serine/threonine protein kinase [Myxococcaceae bacterium]